MRNRYIGEEVSLSPTWEKSRLIWVTVEQWDDGKSHFNNPSFWFEFDGWIYYGVCEYEFGMFEQYEDWIISDNEADFFDQYMPTEIEFNMLVNFKSPRNKVNGAGVPYKTRYYKLDYEKAMKGDLDYWCKFELDFVTEWNRDMKIKKLGI